MVSIWLDVAENGERFVSDVAWQNTPKQLHNHVSVYADVAVEIDSRFRAAVTAADSDGCGRNLVLTAMLWCGCESCCVTVQPPHHNI